MSGSLPSGEVSSAGQTKEQKVAGDQKHSKVSSSYPPIFRAKPGESFKEWKRAVGFWLGGEAGSLPKELIGPRLMVQLRDRAGQLVHHLSNEDVNTADGMELVMATLEKSPLIRQLDKHKVDLHRKRLMTLRRLPQESLESYVTRGQLYRTQLVALDDAMQMGEFFFTGHLLDGARLSRKDKVMIKTRAGSDKEIDVTNAMVELAPELEGESGFPIGSSEPNAAARQGDEFLVQRPENPRYAKREAHAVEYDPFQEEPTDGDEVASLALEEFDPPELLQVANEAFALQHKAKQKIMEVRKLRQYFRRPERADQDERRRSLQERMKNSPCHRCGELGHWSRECPQKLNAAAVASNPKGASSAKSAEDDWAALVSLCHQSSTASQSASSGYKERFAGVVNQVNIHPKETFWCQQELHLHVILDLGCVKSVVGLDWMKSLVKEWKAKGRWLKVQSESERFQFGNGESLTSRYNVQFECMVGGCHLTLCMSVVAGHCPPLLSRHACSQLGLKIDCGNHSFSSTRMGIKTFGMSQASNGHYLLPISIFDDNHVTDIPVDFSMQPGQEAQVLRKLGHGNEVDVSPAAVMFESANDSAIRSEGAASSPGEAHVRGAPSHVRVKASHQKLTPCQVRGDLGHQAKECPLLEEESDQEEAASPEMVVDQGYLELNRKTAPPRRVSRAARQPLQEKEIIETPSTTDWEVLHGLTKDEIEMINKKRTKAALTRSKREAQKALTGEQADYPSLSHVWSQEVAMNMVFSMASRMRVFLWKKLLWQLRVKNAVDRIQGARWKRNPRWLALLLSKEVAALWGHYGALRQRLNARDILHLM